MNASNMKTGIRDVLLKHNTPAEAANFWNRCFDETAQDGNDGKKYGGSINAWIEQEYTTDERMAEDGKPMTGIEYALQAMGIRARSIPERGIQSSHIRAFLDAESASVNYALFQEFVDFTKTVMVPLAQDQLSQVVATTVPFTGAGFQIPYLSDTVADRRMYRVAQASEIPLVSMPYNSRAITPFTYGKGLEITYQALRRSPFTVEVFAMEVQRIAMQSRIDRLRAAADVAINGDTAYGGAVGAATSVNLTTLDSGTTAGNFTYKAYNAMMQLTQNDTSGWYQFDTVIGNAAALTTLLNGSFPTNFLPFINLSTTDTPNSAFIRPAGAFNPLVMINNPDAPANTITLLSSRWALIEGIEQGADLQERERVIRNQTERVYITQSIATGVWHGNARYVVNLNA